MQKVGLLPWDWNLRSIAGAVQSYWQPRVEDDILEASGCYHFMEGLKGKRQLNHNSQ